MRKENLFLLFFLTVSIFLRSQSFFSNYISWKEEQSKPLMQKKNLQNTDLLNFHDSVLFDITKKKLSYHKNDAHSIFIVHNSKYNEMLWNNLGNKVLLRNKKMKKFRSKKEILLEHKPSIFSYIDSSFPKNSKDSLNINFFGKHVYEVLFIPKKISLKNISIIHSYLSLKYGIPLDKGNYYNSKGKVIWNRSDQKKFTHRVTGIGRDDDTGLYQKQSLNQFSKFLTIGKKEIKEKNKFNTSTFDDGNFVIWSDNNGDLSYVKNHDIWTLDRVWKINFIGDNIYKEHYTLRIPCLSNENKKRKIYYMLTYSGNGDKKRIKGMLQNDFVIFDDIDFSSSEVKFSFAYSFLDKKEDITRFKKENTVTPKANLDEKTSLVDYGIRLYPRPVLKDNLFIIDRLPINKEITVHIFDGAGRKIYERKIENKQKIFKHHLSAEGMYIINITSDKKIIKTFKLIVN